MKKTIFSLLLIMLNVFILLADVPKTLSYQGILTDNNGNLVSDGTYELTFELRTNSGDVLWIESHENVPVSNGLFNVILGSINPVDLPFNETYYLGVSINDGATLQPLTELNSVPYSLNVSDESAVKSLNNHTGDIVLQAGDNVSISTNNDTITISSNGEGGSLTLPFNGSVADDIFAFRVNNTGNGIGIYSQANGPNASVVAVNNGDGPAGFFQIANSENNSSALSLTSQGTGNVLTSTNTGTDGHVATFRATNTNNDESAVSIESENGWTALEVVNNAENGLAASFLVANPLSSQIAVLSQNQGSGPAMWGAATGNGIGLKGSSIGTGAALNAENLNGSSKTAEIIDNVDDNTEPTLYVTNNTEVLSIPALKVEPTGRGSGGRFEINNVNNGSTSLSGLHRGNGVAIQGDNNGSGINAVGVWALSSNGSDGLPLRVTQNGSGDNIAVFQNQGTNVVRIDNTGKGFFNGGTQTGGADIAEVFDVEGSAAAYQPGDVLVISQEKDRTVELSQSPYSTLVAGVYATKPGVLLTEHSINTDLSNKVPMGVVGVLPTKISGENGPIKRGDFLVTSSIPGHAMKGTDHKRMLGAIIGKALENFNSNGSGVIKVLVNVK